MVHWWGARSLWPIREDMQVVRSNVVWFWHLAATSSGPWARYLRPEPKPSPKKPI